METTPLPVARKAALQNRVIGLFPQKEAEVHIKKKKKLTFKAYTASV